MLSQDYAEHILKFLYKYLFIYKAVSNGWIVRYVGGNKYEFYTY